MHVVLAGGVGAAKFLRGLSNVVPSKEIVAIVNTGDDDTFHGLWVSPDLDTVTYTLAGLSNDTLGWGVKDESFQAMHVLSQLGGESWFSLGDRDLGTHLYRTDKLAAGFSLTEITKEIALARHVGVRLLPMSNDRVKTTLTIRENGVDRVVGFQEYFVKLAHKPDVVSISYEGAACASPAAGVVEAIKSADTVIIAPSNPVLSIGPILAIPEIEMAIRAARHKTTAVSPIVGGRAIKGPAESNLRSLHGDASAATVALLYRPYCSRFVLDQADLGLKAEVEGLSMEALVTDSIMANPELETSFARRVVDFARAS